MMQRIQISMPLRLVPDGRFQLRAHALAIQPFEGKLFCFTGESYRAKRAEIAETITRLGGKVRSSVSAKTDYLIVGNAGNPCWAYACYGRKIEEAVSLRREGASIVIVNETDFWDAVDDMDITPTIERT